VFEVTSSEVNVTFPYVKSFTSALEQQHVAERNEGSNDERNEGEIAERLVALTSREMEMLRALASSSLSRGEILGAIGLQDSRRSYQRHVVPLVEAGLVSRTIQDNPRSRNQKYALSGPGRSVLNALVEEAS
jgi:FixJ family two-component response regulator